MHEQEPAVTAVHDYELFPKAFDDLCKAVESLPRRHRQRFVGVCARLAMYLRSERRLFEVAQEVIDQLQLDIKYLEFDLDATYRERDDFRAQLEHEGW